MDGDRPGLTAHRAAQLRADASGSNAAEADYVSRLATNPLIFQCPCSSRPVRHS
jgi:hypothetical protein